MRLNKFGKILDEEISNMDKIRPNVTIDERIIMPNHVHVIICIRDIPVDPIVTSEGVYCNTPLLKRHMANRNIKPGFTSPSKTIGAIVRGIKSTVTTQINQSRNTPGTPVWQRNYHEHIIRNKTALYFIRKYIRENPIHWSGDSENHVAREINEFTMV